MQVARNIPRGAHRFVETPPRAAGFTLLEILVVLGIIGVLAGIVLGVTRSVTERSHISRAQVELASLTQALEAYKRQYGDYPWTGTGAGSPQHVDHLHHHEPDTKLHIGTGQAGDSASGRNYIEVAFLNSLLGNLGPQGALITSTDARRAFIEIGKYTVLDPDANPARSPVLRMPSADSPAVQIVNCLMDPWGRPYIYAYKRKSSPASWRQPGYILYSMGPDRRHTPPDTADGDQDRTTPAGYNVDNIYANQ